MTILRTASEVLRAALCIMKMISWRRFGVSHRRRLIAGSESFDRGLGSRLVRSSLGFHMVCVLLSFWLSGGKNALGCHRDVYEAIKLTDVVNLIHFVDTDTV